MDIYKELAIYMYYYITQLGLKYNFHIKDAGESMKGWGTPDKLIRESQLYYLWKNINIMSFDEFKQNYINEFYMKFKDEIDGKDSKHQLYGKTFPQSKVSPKAYQIEEKPYVDIDANCFYAGVIKKTKFLRAGNAIFPIYLNRRRWLDKLNIWIMKILKVSPYDV